MISKRTAISSSLTGLIIIFLFVAVRIWDPSPLEQVRLKTFDLYQEITPRNATEFPVVIVDIDEASLVQFGQWPWPRTRVAELLEQVTNAGAVAIAFDILFTEPDSTSPERIAASIPGIDADLKRRLEELPSHDDRFARAIANSWVTLGQSGTEADWQGERSSPVSSIAEIGDSRPHLIRFPHLLRNQPELEASAAGRGLISLRAEADGIVRRLPAVMMAEDNIVPSLGMELLRIATGNQTILVKATEVGIEAVVIGETLVRTDANGQIWIHFANHNPARYISAKRILTVDFDPAEIEGRLVLVGTSATGLLDIRATPINPTMPGVEVHAQMLENILTNAQLTRPDYFIGAELGLAVVIGLLTILIVPWLGSTQTLGLGAALSIGIAALSWFTFSELRMLFDATYPLISTFFVWLGLTFHNYANEEAEKRWVRSAFGRYLAPAVVERLADEPVNLTLGGETRTLSILFTDVRGFTGISEAYADDPQGLTALMNSFLTPLSEAISDRGGTIDKYLGDAIMAFWNAPLDVPDHPNAACEAALDMLERLDRLNEQRANDAREADLPTPQPIEIGIGINTGECVVGNMGSKLRFDYSALGDSVNLASRIEGLTKQYGFTVMVGSVTAKALFDRYAILEVDRLRVKGKREPETVYALLGGADLRNTPTFFQLREQIDELHSAYRTQAWDVALSTIESIREMSGSTQVVAFLKMFEERISLLRHEPPGEGWDSVFDVTLK